MRVVFAFPLVVIPSVIGLAVACGDEPAATKSESQLTFPYRPQGCDYDVSPPSAIEEAAGHTSRFGAAPNPKHVHVSWAGPTQSTFAVSWATDLETLATQVLYGTDKAAVEAAQGPMPP
jgi:hypothetical protein